MKNRNERGTTGHLIVFLLLALALLAALPLWGTSKKTVPAPSPPTVPAPAFMAQRAEPSAGIHSPPTPSPVPAHAVNLTEINQLIQQGRHAEAEAQLQTLSKEALTDESVRMNASTLWNNLGVRRAKANGMAASVSAYKAALALTPHHPSAFMNLVHAYWKLKDGALTGDMLAEAMRLDPRDPMPHLILSERMIGHDNLAGAMTHLGHAKERIAHSPGEEASLNAQIAILEKAQQAEHRFLARDSAHFTVKYDGGEDHAVWTRVLEILEEAYRDVGQQLGHFPTKPILVVLHTRESFQNATGGPAWSDGLYDPTLGRIKVPTQGALTDQAWLTRVLRHEYVHALLHDRMGGRRGIPQWLNEGLAMQLAGDAPPDIPAVVRGEVTVINLTDLEGPWGGFPQLQARIAYLEGNSATRYLIDRFGMQRVREVLAQLATGQPFAPAFQDRVFISYDDFQRRWVENLNQSLQAG